MNTLKLNKMSAQILSKKQLNVVRGGECSCGCSCTYANSGGSSINANGQANRAGGLWSNASVFRIVYCDTMIMSAGSITYGNDTVR